MSPAGHRGEDDASLRAWASGWKVHHCQQGPRRRNGFDRGGKALLWGLTAPEEPVGSQPGVPSGYLCLEVRSPGWEERDMGTVMSEMDAGALV